MSIAMLDGLEDQIQSWYKSIPDLPEGFREWLAKYAWIFMIVGAVFLAFASLALLSIIGLVTSASVIYGSTYSLFAWLALLFMIPILYFTVVSINPLKEMKSEGWKILYYLQFFYLFYSVLQWLTWPSNVGKLVGAVLGFGVGMYFVFQLKKHFK